jgi:ABC-2 type transport system ATP-binding protein
VKDLVRALAQGGVSVLMTSHLLADVEDVCDRVAILERGALRAEGMIADLLRQPDAVRFEVEGLDERPLRRCEPSWRRIRGGACGRSIRR